jgi:hypothetical protein
MPEPRLHLDADISGRVLQQALVNRGHDVTRTPNDWIAEDASDELQLLRLRLVAESSRRTMLATSHDSRVSILVMAASSWFNRASWGCPD